MKHTKSVFSAVVIIAALALLFFAPTQAANVSALRENPIQGNPPPPPVDGDVPFEFDVTADFLVGLGAAALALAFDYIPKLSGWYDLKSEIEKRQIMAGLILAGAAFVYGGQCLGIFFTNLACTQAGVMEMVYAVFVAITVNQGTHLMFKPTKPDRSSFRM